MSAAPVQLRNLDTLWYPTWFTGVFDYYATGEGRTVGICMGYARSASDLDAALRNRFDDYFLRGAEVWPRIHVPAEVEDLIPSLVTAFANDPQRIAGDFRYEGLFHLNRS